MECLHPGHSRKVTVDARAGRAFSLAV